MKYEIAEKVNQSKKIYTEIKELNVNEFIDEMIEIEKTNKQHRIGNTADEGFYRKYVQGSTVVILLNL